MVHVLVLFEPVMHLHSAPYDFLVLSDIMFAVHLCTLCIYCLPEISDLVMY